MGRSSAGSANARCVTTTRDGRRADDELATTTTRNAIEAARSRSSHSKATEPDSREPSAGSGGPTLAEGHGGLGANGGNAQHDRQPGRSATTTSSWGCLRAERLGAGSGSLGAAGGGIVSSLSA